MRKITSVTCYISAPNSIYLMKIERTALVTHSAENMYGLVHDVNAYPEFLKWCNIATVHEQDEASQLASIGVTVAGISQSFKTRNTLVPGTKLELSLVDGPFQDLRGEWNFKALNSKGCKVSLILDFEFTPGLMSTVFKKGFKKIADQLVQDFCRRADDVFGDEVGKG